MANRDDQQRNDKNRPQQDKDAQGKDIGRQTGQSSTTGTTGANRGMSGQ
ncbi:MAG: hypothetical protein Q7R81_05115 [Candidatus Peregrinibacteria bacterium]|nr:hypothetical protein [Candidatus Peregrinibacteria bacterium]